MNEQELLKNKILDADKTAYERNILKVCGFLSLDEQSVYHGLQKEFLTKEHFLSGGHEEAERVMAFFLPDYLDRESAEIVRDMLLEANQKGTTIITASHDPMLLQSAHRVIVVGG